MSFLNYITPSDQLSFSIIENIPMMNKGKSITLTEILSGDPDIAFSFLKNNVCFNKIIEPIKVKRILPTFFSTPDNQDSFLTQLYAYSDWMKMAIKAIKSLGPDQKDNSDDQMIAGLIEMVVIKKFISLSLPPDHDDPELKNKSRKLFNNFIDKLYPSVLFHTTWEIILSAFIQSFPTDIPYIINMFTDLIEKKISIKFFSEYKLMLNCVERNSLLNNYFSYKSELIEIFLNPNLSAVRQDIKTMFVLLCLKNTGKHNLIMHAIEGCQSQIQNSQDQLSDYQNWISLIKKIFIAIESGGSFLPILGAIFEDQQLHPKWFPILVDYPRQDTFFFRLLFSIKGSRLYEYIVKEHLNFFKNPDFPMIKALKNEYGRSYLEYCNDNWFWCAQDLRVNTQSLLESLVNANKTKPLTSKSANIIAETLFIRGLQNEDVYLFGYVIEACDISEYQKLASNIPLLLKLPSEIGKLFAHSWIEKSKNDSYQIQIMNELIKQLNQNSQTDQLIETKKILKEHIYSAELRSKKIAEELFEQAEKEEKEKEEKKIKNKKKKSKNKPANNNLREKIVKTDLVETLEKKENHTQPEMKKEKSNDIILKNKPKVCAPPKKKAALQKQSLASEEKSAKPKEKDKKELDSSLKVQPAEPSILKEPDLLPIIQTALPDQQNTLDPALELENEIKKEKESVTEKPRMDVSSLLPPIEAVLPKEQESDPIQIEKENEIEETKEERENQSTIENLMPNSQKNIHFFYNPEATPWMPPKNKSNLLRPVKTKDSVLPILESIKSIYKNIYFNKASYPTLQFYGSSSERLFDETFFKNNQKKLSPNSSEIHDIDLYLHLPDGIDDTIIAEWSDKLKNRGASFQYFLDRRKTDDYVQLSFVFQDSQIDLTLSVKPLKQIFDLPTIILNPNERSIGNFCIPGIFYDNHKNFKKIICFNSDLNCEDLLNPRTLSFIWKKWAYLRAANYRYDKSVIHMMRDLEEIIFDTPEVIHQSLSLFFNEYFPKNPDFFFNQFKQDTLKITTLDPYLLAATLQGYVYGPRFKAS
jgi:hypothetical protein